MTPERARHLQSAAWIGTGLAAIALLWALGPVLSPFLLALTLAYIANPLVERLVARRVPRILAVTLILLSGLGLTVSLALILVPLLRNEITQITTRLPDLVNLISDHLLPWLKERFGLNLHLDVATARQFITEHLGGSGDLAGKVLTGLGSGGLALFTLVANLVLMPVVLFYLLQDWPTLVSHLDRLIPRPWHAHARRVLGDVDSVLSEFLRGELLVMLLLALYYAGALWLAGLTIAIPVGIVTGLLIFIPYVGFTIGFVLALVVALLQFQGFPPILAVLVVYGIGQVLEGFLLTPFLVGERIGLHPLAVIFALMAFGQLFGFVGVLAALPASAALLVGLRELKILYLASPFYKGVAK